MARSNTPPRSVRQPEGKVRRSQMLTTYGPGALVDFLDYAVIINGLDAWRFGATGIEQVSEPRLRDRLAARLRQAGQSLGEAAFRLPPAGDDDTPNPAHGVTARLFPRWFVCQDIRCRALVHYRSLEFRSNRFRHDCGANCVPVRFVQACSHGHIDDLNWIGVAHAGPPCDAPELVLEQGVSGDFGEVRVVCQTCGARRALANLKAKEMEPQCSGRRPWLGMDGTEDCDQKAKLIVRTASGAYFSQTDSALQLPDDTNALYDAVWSNADTLLVATPQTLPVFRTIPKIGLALDGYPDADVLAMIEVVKAGKKPARLPLRQAEFQAFMGADPEQPGDLAPPDEKFFARRATGATPAGIGRVVLAHALREVRAQLGFTRLTFPSPSFTGESAVDARTAALGLTTDWLPAVEMFGEGVFLTLDEAALQAWEDREAVQVRSAALAAAHAARYANDPVAPAYPGVRFYLLHSLAHLLLTAISLECGYSASAIRERIYSAPRDSDQPMAAILLMTATPGSEGTLGGLVDQGRVLDRHLAHALRLGRLCSNDPVCASHAPGDALGSVDGAACHGCLYVAESSCEFFNRYLDRALVVPCLGHDPALAFFDGGTGWASI